MPPILSSLGVGAVSSYGLIRPSGVAALINTIQIFTYTQQWIPPAGTTTVDYLVVAGGGAGGSLQGGAGGGGGGAIDSPPSGAGGGGAGTFSTSDVGSGFFFSAFGFFKTNFFCSENKEIPSLFSNPSISAKSWFNVCSRSSLPPRLILKVILSCNRLRIHRFLHLLRPSMFV